MKSIMAEGAIISEENRALFSSLTSELNSLRQSLRELDLTCYCTEDDCPFRAEDMVGSRRHYAYELPPKSPTSPKTSIKRWIVLPNKRHAAATEQRPRPRPKSAVLYLPDDTPPYELIKQKQVDSVFQKYNQSIDDETPRTWESCEDADGEERPVSDLVFVRHSRARTNIRLRRCSSAGCT